LGGRAQHAWAVAQSALARDARGGAWLAGFGVTTLLIVLRSTVTRTLGAISTSISSEPSLTRLTVAMMPPPVTTRSPRRS
jgi:hypothetical protein